MRITGTHWLTRFELRHGQAPQYRAGRVFLAGDSAHIHSPAGALGIVIVRPDGYPRHINADAQHGCDLYRQSLTTGA